MVGSFKTTSMSLFSSEGSSQPQINFYASSDALVKVTAAKQTAHADSMDSNVHLLAKNAGVPLV